ncbi:MAG: hypothetical protein U1E37_07975 [Sphingomonadaceae bacterium]
MRKIAAMLALALLPAGLLAAPGDMNVATFLAKADALKAKGAMAMFSSDIGLLRTEGQAAGEAYRARLAKERAAGRPSSCPPQGVKVNSNDVLAHLRTYPAAARGAISMKQAMADFFIKRFPCR